MRFNRELKEIMVRFLESSCERYCEKKRLTDRKSRFVLEYTRYLQNLVDSKTNTQRVAERLCEGSTELL